METKTALEISVLKVLEALKTANYCHSTILVYQRAYNRLLKKALNMKIVTFCDVLAESFTNDFISRKTGLYCHTRKRLHNSCIRKLRECEEKGYIGWMKYVESSVDKPESIRFQNLHVEFLEYLKVDNKNENTIVSYRNISCKFLVFIEKLGYIDLRIIPMRLVNEFFSDLRNTWEAGSLRTAACGLRSFLKFAEGGSRLLTAVPNKLPKKITIIPILTNEEEEAIWDVLKMDVISLRDKAIMVLLLLTGLRSVDIVNLRLSDIDWNCDVISICQKKTNIPLVLPLLPAIGNAMARYIINDRPKSNSPYVFLTYNAPHTQLNDHANCYAVVIKIFTCAGIKRGKEIKGTRLLRHHMASKMLRKGVVVQTISSVLGHVNPNSVSIYLTTDEKKLRECALSLLVIPMKVRGLL